MNFEEYIHAKVSEMKQAEFASKPIRTVGEVILLLERQPSTNIVKLDFTEDNPERLISYRGYYEALCLDYDSTANDMTVWELLRRFKGAIGQVFVGYKGGDFEMHTKTRVWVAPYSECGRMLTDIVEKAGVTVICTQEDD